MLLAEQQGSDIGFDSQFERDTVMLNCASLRVGVQIIEWQSIRLCYLQDHIVANRIQSVSVGVTIEGPLRTLYKMG